MKKSILSLILRICVELLLSSPAQSFTFLSPPSSRSACKLKATATPDFWFDDDDDDENILFEFSIADGPEVDEDDGEDYFVSDESLLSELSTMNVEYFDADELHRRVKRAIEKEDDDDLYSAIDTSTFIQLQMKKRQDTKLSRRARQPESVFIILFAPDTDDEGVHTVEFPPTSGRNIILAFESEDSCNHFSDKLREQGVFEPCPEQMNLEGLEAYCKQLNVQVEVVPTGIFLRPPGEFVDNLTHDPHMNSNRANLERIFALSNDDGDGDEDDLFSNDQAGAWE